MMRRAILAFAALIALSQSATAGVLLFGHVSCAVVRFYVAKYSEAAAETWARGHGASEADIETARRCLHGATVQTAARSHDVSVQGQRADPEQNSHDDAADVHDVIRPKDIADRSAGNASDETRDDPVPASGKTATSRPGSVGAVHRGARMGVVAWLNRQWDHLVGRRHSRIALFSFPRSRSHKRSFLHLFSGTVSGHGAG